MGLNRNLKALCTVSFRLSCNTVGSLNTQTLDLKIVTWQSTMVLKWTSKAVVLHQKFQTFNARLTVFSWVQEVFLTVNIPKSLPAREGPDVSLSQ